MVGTGGGGRSSICDVYEGDGKVKEVMKNTWERE